MNTNPPLIPHPDNVLGRGILNPNTEACLLADGMRFATVLVPAGRGRTHPLILCGRRCPNVAGRDGLRDWANTQRLVVAGQPAGAVALC